MTSTTQAPSAAARRIYSPAQKDAATFLVTAEESGGEYTLLEVELAPGGGNELHYHADFTEGFEVLEGELVVQVGREEYVLGPGSQAFVRQGTLHRFVSRSSAPTRFRVELRPGHTGFENALRIGYGLSADGLATRKGIPRSLSHLAILVEMAGTVPVGAARILLPLLRFVARRARRRGVEAELLARYCPPFSADPA